MERLPWVERKFDLDIPPGWMANILERLIGTRIRIIELCAPLTRSELTTRIDDRWSILEQVGHLVDLEGLHEGRIDDFEQNADVMRAADMKNVATYQAEHNSKDLSDLLEAFTKARNQFVDRLRGLNDDVLERSIEHPRLKVNMRPVDLAFFTAEHDDHHLASIRQIREQLDGAN